MRYLLIILSLLSLACGKKEDPILPQVISEQLKIEIDRIEPQLLWCYGTPAVNRINNVTKEPMCDVGDSAANLGLVMLYGKMGSMKSVYKYISEDGRPWRNESYVNKDTSDTFSRDQLIGTVESTVASGDKVPLQRIWAYIQAHNGKMCPVASDNKCDISPFGSQSVSILVKDALGLDVKNADRIADFGIVNAEAATAPEGYRSFLIARLLFLKVFQGKLTVEYAHAAKILSERNPNNVWYKLLERVTHKGTDADFETIGRDMLPCLQAWQSPGVEWSWYGSGGSKCLTKDTMGHELVFGARFLLRYYNHELVSTDL